jgi:tRNA(Ile)-lysidine synthase
MDFARGLCLDASVAQVFEQYLKRPTRIYVGLSGGSDSVALLHSVAHYVHSHSEHGVTAVHINHGLQSEADKWERFCAAFAKSLSVPFISKKIAVTDVSTYGVEAAARDARITAFQKLIDPGEPHLLVLAHHQDDQVETFMLRLLRGAGLSGLCSMRLYSSQKHLRVLRPLLGIQKSRILQYLQDNALSYVNDPSNLQTHFTRNKVRHQLLPSILQQWPSIYRMIARTVTTLQSDLDCLQVLASEKFATLVSMRFGIQCMHVDRLSQYSSKMQCLFLRMFVREQGFYDLPDLIRLQTFIDQVIKAKPGAQCSLETKSYRIVYALGDLYCLPAGGFNRCTLPIIVNSQQTEVSIWVPVLIKVYLPWQSAAAESVRAGQQMVGRLVFRGQKDLSPLIRKSFSQQLLAARVPAFLRDVVPMLVLPHGTCLCDISVQS